MSDTKNVPVEPTEEMLVAGLIDCNPLGGLVDWRGLGVTNLEDVAGIYAAMLAAAPSVPVTEVRENAEPKRWLLEEHLPSGSVRWSAFAHEHHCRQVAAKSEHPTTVTTLYALSQPPADLQVQVDRLTTGDNDTLSFIAGFEAGGKTERERSELLEDEITDLKARLETAAEDERDRLYADAITLPADYATERTDDWLATRGAIMPDERAALRASKQEDRA